MQQLTLYTGPLKETVVDHEEYGTLVQKDKKKKKKKNRQPNRSKQIDQEKIRQQALQSQIYQVQELSPEEKNSFAIAEIHPLKLICTNLPFKITIQELFQYFNTVISTSNPQLANPPPIKDVEFEKKKTFAVLTVASRRIKDFFRNHREFNYIQGTTTFKIEKPREFFAEKYLKKNQSITVGTDNKIYLGGLPLSLNDEQVKKICLTFGKLKYFNLVREEGVSKGYCFMEYEQHAAGQKAMKALNGMAVADKKLKCHSANLGNKALSLGFTPGSAGLANTDPSAKPANHAFGSYLLSYENITNLDIQMTLQNQPMCKVPSRVLQLLNMCYPEDLFDQQFVQDLQNDVSDECKKYGPIESVIIPRPDPLCGYAGPSVGKVFVKFMYITQAKRARFGLSGRVYNKRTVIGSFYPQQKFNMKEYLVSI